MTVEFAPNQSRLAQWAVGTASTAVGLLIAVLVFFGTVTVFGGHIGDNWVAIVGMIGIAVGLAGSVVAFLMALAARVKHDHWQGLRLPITLFPVLLILLAVGELFWWE